ncbi:penicillin-binding protein 1A [Uliginosibacterium gangwonense]|uniref:penicillin-binding protein 1A n=1 Tax=Uliginosibacterium gangwonense TaxID=392736 RepID=UPI000380E358|nr:penicillin-binding protein 1A [Uliginosibacterium gangwonense]
MRTRPLLLSLLFVGTLLVLGAASIAVAAAFAWPKLPSLDALTDYKPRIPLRVYTADGALIGEFGEERRTYIAINDVPEKLKQAIVSAEDDRFFEHSGVDFSGLIRATLLNLIGGSKRQGGSTITMQVARNFYLSREKTISRKLYEILLALKIEHNLSKEKILEVYINQIYLGQRAYGFANAAQTYFGREVSQLSVAEYAMLAGLPKAPSAYNPVTNLPRATLRQHYVLRRMRDLNYLDEETYQQALSTPMRLAIGRNAQASAVAMPHAEYVAEMARQMAYDQFKEEAYTRGIKVITTIVKADQQAAYEALRKNILSYEQRHAYRGPEDYVDLSNIESNKDEALEEMIDAYPDLDEMKPGIVLQASRQLVKVYMRGGELVDLSGDSLRFPGPMLSDNAPQQKRIRPGAIIRLVKGSKNWLVTQPPEVEGAFVSLDPRDGSIHSLVGGFDYNRNKFNHVTQAWRQAGSSFKPFIYSAAIDKGYTPGSVFQDAPLNFSSEETGGRDWNPQNYDNRYEGPMSLRTALAKSKNVVAIRVLQAIGVRYAQDYVTSRFGFDPAKNPPYLTLALGAGSVTPWQMASAYAIFANGGYRIQPYLVKEMQDSSGHVLARVTPSVAGQQAERVIDPRNDYLMDMMMKDVVRRGTAAKAMSLGRSDLAGKTGTTNEYVDAWFCGYQPTLVGVSWIGFDQPKKLGSGETGGLLALPMWIDYMRVALKGVPEQFMSPPSGLVKVQPTIEKEGDDFIYEEHMPAPPAADAPEPDPAAQSEPTT